MMMSQKKFDTLVLGALQNEDIQSALCAVINLAFVREIKLQRKGMDDEHPVITEETVNMVDMIATYLPRAEGAIRGVQQDAAAARNRAEASRLGVQALLGAIERQAAGQIAGGAAQDAELIPETTENSTEDDKK